MIRAEFGSTRAALAPNEERQWAVISSVRSSFDCTRKEVASQALDFDEARPMRGH